MELFKQFPPDIQAYILKENPRFREINQYYAIHGKHLFEEKYCNDPISKHEFFSYIDSNTKPNFTIYAINDDVCEIWQFVYNRGNYMLYKVRIEKVVSHERVYFIFNNKYAPNAYLDNIKNLYYTDNIYLHSIDDLYSKYKYIHYDIITVNNIIKARKCSIPNHNITYSINYLDKMLSYTGEDATLDNFYNMSILNIYFGNKDVISNVVKDSDQIVFSEISNDKNMVLYDKIIKIYKHNISTGYELQLQQLH